MRRNYNSKFRRPQRPKQKAKDGVRQVTVRNGDVDTALKIFKKKVKKSGILVDLKKREFFETRNEKARKTKNKAIRRVRNLKLKQERLDAEYKFRIR